MAQISFDCNCGFNIPNHGIFPQLVSSTGMNSGIYKNVLQRVQGNSSTKELRFSLTRMIETRTDRTSRVIHIDFNVLLLKDDNLARLIVLYFRVVMMLSNRPYIKKRECHDYLIL